MTADQAQAVPRRDMTTVASGFRHPPPPLPADEHRPEVIVMNAKLWGLVNVTLFRAKVALQHHGYDDVLDEINGAVGEVAEAWADVLDPDGTGDHGEEHA